MIGGRQRDGLQDGWAVVAGSADPDDAGADGSAEPEGEPDGPPRQTEQVVGVGEATGVADGAAGAGAGAVDDDGGRLGPSVQPAPTVALEQAETIAVSATATTTAAMRCRNKAAGERRVAGGRWSDPVIASSAPLP